MEFIVHTLKDSMHLPIDADAVSYDTPLGPGGLDLESLAFVELTIHLEKEFDLRFPEGEVEEAAQATVGDLVRAIKEHMPASA